MDDVGSLTIELLSAPDGGVVVHVKSPGIPALPLNLVLVAEAVVVHDRRESGEVGGGGG